MKISIDCDETLLHWEHAPKIWELIKILIQGGADVWILTGRNEDNVNTDLFRKMNEIGIPKHKILFVGSSLKVNEFIRNCFDLHIDNDWLEVSKINESGNFSLLCGLKPVELKEEFEMHKI
jgi:hydroxymethylpyrimidine pyrophosphatase-like HAD family hydrolase